MHDNQAVQLISNPLQHFASSDVLEVWLEYKRQHELDPVRLRPHPWEFYLYFDV